MSEQHKNFWDKEYRTGKHFALSTRPSEDLAKFTRWLARQYGGAVFNKTTRVLDLGCGNGRNLVYLAQEFGCRGIGYDISSEAIAQAEAAKKSLPLSFGVRSIDEPLPEATESTDVVLDMMTSHFLKQAEREKLLAEIIRVLKPGGWLFFKTFLLDEDLHAKRLLRTRPADEPQAYIHPELGVYEYVWTEAGLYSFFGPYFEIHKVDKSHKHLIHGKAGKRRTMSAYLEKK